MRIPHTCVGYFSLMLHLINRPFLCSLTDRELSRCSSYSTSWQRLCLYVPVPSKFCRKHLVHTKNRNLGANFNFSNFKRIVRSDSKKIDTLILCTNCNQWINGISYSNRQQPAFYCCTVLYCTVYVLWTDECVTTYFSATVIGPIWNNLISWLYFLGISIFMSLECTV